MVLVLLPLSHAANPPSVTRSTVPRSTLARRRRPFAPLPESSRPNRPIPLRLASQIGEPSVALGLAGRSRFADADAAVVSMVSVVVRAVLPSATTDAGLNEHVASAGSSPQLNVMVPL